MQCGARAHGRGTFASVGPVAVSIAAQDLHHAIFGGQLEFLDPFFFDFLFVGQVVFASKDFEFAFELLVLAVEALQGLVVGQMLPNEFFLSMLHTPSVPILAGLFKFGLKVASGALMYSGSRLATRSISPRANRAAPIAATETPRISSVPVSKTAALWPLVPTKIAASFAFESPINVTSSVMC